MVRRMCSTYACEASSGNRGWARHQHFGLRREWLALYLEHPADWRLVGGLGNRQVQSLDVWLRTAGLVDRSGRETWLCHAFRSSGTDTMCLWECLWAGVALAFPTAGWYAHLGPSGGWTTVELRSRLGAHVPRLAARTVSNAVMELVGLLERTPVGRHLGQGEVLPGRPRMVHRHGLANPSPGALLYACVRLGERERRAVLGLDEDLTWPWVIFGCDRNDALITIAALCQPWATVGDGELRLRPPTEEHIYADLR